MKENIVQKIEKHLTECFKSPKKDTLEKIQELIAKELPHCRLDPEDDTYLHCKEDGKKYKIRIGKVLRRLDQDLLMKYIKEKAESTREKMLVNSTLKRVRDSIKSKVKENPMKNIIGKYELDKNNYLVISQDPFDITFKSTCRPWETDSCERIGGMYGNPMNEKKCGFCSDIKNNNAIAYIVDKNTGKWKARWMMRWCIQEHDDETRVVVEPSYYDRNADLGDLLFKAENKLKGILEENDLLREEDKSCCVKYPYWGYSDLANTSGYFCYGEADRATLAEKMGIEIFSGRVRGGYTETWYYVPEWNEIYVVSSFEDYSIDVNDLSEAFRTLIEESGKNHPESISYYMEDLVQRGYDIDVSEIDPNYEEERYLNPKDSIKIVRTEDGGFGVIFEKDLEYIGSRMREQFQDHDDIYKIVGGVYKGKFLEDYASRFQRSPAYEAEILEENPLEEEE